MVQVIPNRLYKLRTTRSWDYLGLSSHSPTNLLHETKMGDGAIIGLLDTGSLSHAHLYPLIPPILSCKPKSQGSIEYNWCARWRYNRVLCLITGSSHNFDALCMHVRTHLKLHHCVYIHNFSLKATLMSWFDLKKVGKWLRTILDLWEVEKNRWVIWWDALTLFVFPYNLILFSWKRRRISHQITHLFYCSS